MNDLEVREYLGKSISFKRINGMIYANATEMAKIFNKEVRRWTALDSTKRYINALTEKMSTELVVVNQGGIPSEQGTWIHERLVIKFAEWLDVNFEIWCDEQIANLIKDGYVSIKSKTENEMLLELFPTSDRNLIALTSDSIREVKRLTLDNNMKDNKIKEDAPKVNFADRITNSSDAIDIGSFVKVLHDENIKIGRNTFFEWLRTNKYLMSNNIPFQKYINNGYFKVIETVKKTVYGDKIFPKSLITGKGQLIIAEKLRVELGGK